jgi:hypothetical protein
MFLICTIHQVILWCVNEVELLGGACSMHGGMEKYTQDFIQETWKDVTRETYACMGE